jgi:hypothetical protein
MAAIPPIQNEFSRLLTEGPEDMKRLVQKYPIAALVSVVVLSFLGLMLVFSFSITCIAAGALFGLAAFGLGEAMWLDCNEYWKHFKQSLAIILFVEPPRELAPSPEIVAPRTK